jgi:hypothetical protein
MRNARWEMGAAGTEEKKLTPCLRVLAGKTAFGSPEGEMSGSERVKF